MKIKLYIKKEYIENYNKNHDTKIVNEQCELLKEGDNQTLVLLQVNIKDNPYIIRYIPNDFLMIDYKGEK